MDRNEILANFQACSGVDDIGECMAILEQHDWDLQRAVSVSLSSQDHHSGMDQSFQINHGPKKMVTFSCILGETTKDITIDDSNTVGDLKQIASIELGITPGEMDVDGWPKESKIQLPNDNTVLSTMQLPHFNRLRIKMQCPIPGVSLGFDDSDTSPVFIPCNVIAGNSSQSTTDIVDLTKQYRLQISDETHRQRHFLNCEGSKTVQELKEDVFKLTKIPVLDQNWSGFPTEIPPSDDGTIASLNLNSELQPLSVRQKPPKPIPTHQNPFSVLQPNTSHTLINNGSQTNEIICIDDLSSDDDEQFIETLDDDMMFKDVTVPKTSSLMPEKVENEVFAEQQFKSEFLSRYTEAPDFHLDSLVSAVNKAFGCPARQRKGLAVYLHHDGSIQSNVFCSQLLANKSIIDYLDLHFVTWAWDVTSSFNKERFLQICTQHLGVGVTQTIKRTRNDNFPLLILAHGKGRSCDVTAIIQGNTDLNELMARLIKANEDAEAQKLIDIQEEDARKVRENIKREQEEAYQQSLEADRAKLLAEQEQERLQKEEEEQKKRVQGERMENIQRLKGLVPAEPESGSGERISRVRFRKPDGSTITRSFYASDSLQDLINFVGSLGFPDDQYRILKSWPKQNLLSLDRESSLESNKIFPQDSLIIEELPDFES